MFDYTVQREGQVKHIAMYYEHRFTKLGYWASSILWSLPYLHMLLSESHLSNQHIEIVQMFLDFEFLMTKLQVPNVSSSHQWPEMQHYWHSERILSQVPTCSSHPPQTNVAQHLLKMCEDTATVLEWQAGREYGFVKEFMQHQDQRNCI